MIRTVLAPGVPWPTSFYGNGPIHIKPRLYNGELSAIISNYVLQYPGCTAAQIAKDLGKHKGTVNEALMNLYKKGEVGREREPNVKTGNTYYKYWSCE